ncbi:hypothetical protein GCM10008949_41320 [Deinococcus humi]|nr:hypothetical protein GCM10008949_41320 [Deinococcus humi]
MGRSRPVMGADTRICKSTVRPGAGSTTGATETTGVEALTGMVSARWLGWLMV